MSRMTDTQRGDLAEAMLPVAANLAVLVHGDGGREDVADVLAGLSEQEKTAVIVVLAGLVNPEQSVSDALSWLDFDERGELTVPASWSERRTVRDLAPEDDGETDDDYVDAVAVEKYLDGAIHTVTPAERLAAVALGVKQGITYLDVDARHNLRRGTTATFISRIRRRYEEEGKPFPSLTPPGQRDPFTEEEVVLMREQAAAGRTDIEIAMSFGLNDPRTVSAICRGVMYARYGGPIRVSRSAKGVEASREFMCGHAGGSQEAARGRELGEVA